MQTPVRTLPREGRPLRVAAIHDLSGFGRCSLSVILPTLSAMGVQVCPVPTAVLSSHTGGLGKVVLRDLTDFIPACLEHYRRLELEFECIYSGFLGSQEQIDHCLAFLAAYPDALAVVDPVMGDHGKPYRTCTPDMVRRMRELVQAADVITPNLTEACMLLEQPFPAQGLTHTEARSLLVQLSRLCGQGSGRSGPDCVVITGVPMASGSIATLGYDKSHNAFWLVPCDYLPVAYPGTGDLFASVLTGGFLTGDSLPMAMGRATDFVERCIRTTFSYSSDPRYGVMLEKELGALSGRGSVKAFSPL